MSGSEWLELGRAEAWPSFRRQLPHAPDAEALLVEHLLPERLARILDLGTGDGHLLAAIRGRHPETGGVGLDVSPEMVSAARKRFAESERVSFEVHDLMKALPKGLGEFDLVVSALAIHHLPDDRKRSLYGEALGLLRPGGAFYNLDVINAPTLELHELSQRSFGFSDRDPDPSDQLAPLDDQLEWLREVGFDHVDCHWKWLELALFGGIRPAGGGPAAS
jgi:tRNA (cmo5U34)-methyltransferase